MATAMVVLSGGQDSTACLLWAKNVFDTVRAVTFDYNQRHSREIAAARKVCEVVGVESHDIIRVGPLLRSRSPLTDANAVLETYKDYESMDKIIGDRVELTFVPMRNAFFLTLAANIALSYDSRDLVTGVCQADNANYPDCRATFIGHQEETINQALGISDFRIHTPLMDMSKAESVRWVQDFPRWDEAMAQTHTCYAGEFPPCGKCHSCVLRAHGFAEANVADPLVERAKGHR